MIAFCERFPLCQVGSIIIIIYIISLMIRCSHIGKPLIVICICAYFTKEFLWSLFQEMQYFKSCLQLSRRVLIDLCPVLCGCQVQNNEFHGIGICRIYFPRATGSEFSHKLEFPGIHTVITSGHWPAWPQSHTLVISHKRAKLYVFYFIDVRQWWSSVDILFYDDYSHPRRHCFTGHSISGHTVKVTSPLW